MKTIFLNIPYLFAEIIINKIYKKQSMYQAQPKTKTKVET